MAAKQLNLGTLEQISGKLLLHISSLIKGRFPEKRVGPKATYINEDESLEQIDILLAKKPTETHNKDILDSGSDDSKMATTDSDLDTQQPHSVGNKRIPAMIKSPSK